MSKQTINVKALGFVDIAGQALHAAEGLATKVAEDERQVAELAPQRADALHEANFIEASEKAAAVAQLSSHPGALAIIGNLIKINQETKSAFAQKLAALGQGHAEPGNGQKSNDPGKQACVSDSYDDGGFVGQRAGLGEKRASDLALTRGLGIPDGQTGG